MNHTDSTCSSPGAGRPACAVAGRPAYILRALIANARVRVAEVEAAQESVLDGCDAPMCGAAWDHLLKLEAELSTLSGPSSTAPAAPAALDTLAGSGARSRGF